MGKPTVDHWRVGTSAAKCQSGDPLWIIRLGCSHSGTTRARSKLAADREAKENCLKGECPLSCGAGFSGHAATHRSSSCTPLARNPFLNHSAKDSSCGGALTGDTPTRANPNLCASVFIYEVKPARSFCFSAFIRRVYFTSF